MDNRSGYYEPRMASSFLDLPVVALPMNVMDNSRHWHDHAEILFCKKGDMHLQINETYYILSPGDFILINGGESHRIFNGARNNLQISTFIEEEILGNMNERIICCQSIRETGTASHQPEREIISQTDAELIRFALENMAYMLFTIIKEKSAVFISRVGCQRRNLRGDELFNEEQFCRYQMYMYQLLSVLMKYKEQGRHIKRKNERIKQCIEYIHDHIGENLSAKNISHALHISEPTIYRAFHDQVGMSLLQYITEVRLEAVCRYLRDTDDSVTDIAMACGFTGVSNFYRVFRQYQHMSPTEYRTSEGQTKRNLPFYQPPIMLLNRYQNDQDLEMLTQQLLHPKMV